MDRAGVQAWVGLYERAWRTPGTELLAELFAPEATYQTAPFEEPFQGLPAIAVMLTMIVASLAMSSLTYRSVESAGRRIPRARRSAGRTRRASARA